MQNEKKQYVWMIRNMTTGEFQSGTSPGKFTKNKGKKWSALGYLKAHIKNITSSWRQGREFFKRWYGVGQKLDGSSTWEVVKYELVEVEAIPYDALIPQKNIDKRGDY